MIANNAFIIDEMKEQAKKEGKLEEKIETAKNLLELGVEIDKISKATGLPEKIIIELSKDK